MTVVKALCKKVPDNKKPNNDDMDITPSLLAAKQKVLQGISPSIGVHLNFELGKIVLTFGASKLVYAFERATNEIIHDVSKAWGIKWSTRPGTFKKGSNKHPSNVLQNSLF